MGYGSTFNSPEMRLVRLTPDLLKLSDIRTWEGQTFGVLISLLVLGLSSSSVSARELSEVADFRREESIEAFLASRNSSSVERRCVEAAGLLPGNMARQNEQGNSARITMSGFGGFGVAGCERSVRFINLDPRRILDRPGRNTDIQIEEVQLPVPGQTEVEAFNNKFSTLQQSIFDAILVLNDIEDSVVTLSFSVELPEVDDSSFTSGEAKIEYMLDNTIFSVSVNAAEDSEIVREVAGLIKDAGFNISDTDGSNSSSTTLEFY